MLSSSATTFLPKTASIFISRRRIISGLILRQFGTSTPENERGKCLSKTTIRNMRVSELRVELERRGVPADGLKADLVQKLLDELFEKKKDEGGGKVYVEKTKRRKEIAVDPKILHVLRFKGESNHLSASASFGAVLYDAETNKSVWKGRLYLQGGESIQEAEYIGLKRTIPYIHNFGVRQLILQGNNTSTVVKHLTTSYRAKAKNLKGLLSSVRDAIDDLEHCEVWGINPGENKKAASLSRIAMKTKASDGFDTPMKEAGPNTSCGNMNKINTRASMTIESCTHLEKSSKKEALVHKLEITLPTLSPEKVYVLRFDGGSRSNPGIAGCGMVIFDSESQLEVWSAYKFLGEATNNVAEYIALCEGLTFAKLMGVKHLVAEGDSQLVINQINGVFQVKNEKLKHLYQQVNSIKGYFDSIQLKDIPREENFRADQLANVAMDNKASSAMIVAHDMLVQHENGMVPV